MTAGHFGLAAAIKSRTPNTPLWSLMLATYLLDVLFIVLAGFGVESFQQIDPAHPAYGGAIIHALYTHSLIGAVVIAVVAGLIAGRAWSRSAGWIIGGVVFSHWLLDLIVHRPDMPILPDNLGDLPLLGFGLWNFPAIGALLELAIVLAGGWLYYCSVVAGAESETAEPRAVIAGGVTAALMVLLLGADYFGLSLLIAIVLMLALIVLSGWLDARLGRASAA